MIEILRVIGARLAGDPKVGAKEGCTKLISNSYMRRFKRSRSIHAFLWANFGPGCGLPLGA